jgi:folate-binding protein YgfZ
VQGPQAEAAVAALGVFAGIPGQPLASTKISDPTLGEIYLANHARLVVGSGFDLFVPNASLSAVADRLIAAAKALGGGACGWQAWETARIEAGIPRYGMDMDETSLPLECGLETRAITYTKGCYLGQEVINRIHSVGHVNRALSGLRLLDQGGNLPQRGDKLFQAGKAVGHVTSAVRSPLLKAGIALGYVRFEARQEGTEVTVRTAHGDVAALVTALPFAAA